MSLLRLIAGSGRSGTTWVQDALARANGMRPVFEPLNPWATTQGRRYAHRALKPGEIHPELRSFIEDVVSGKRARLWTKYRRQWRWFLPRSDEIGDIARGAGVLHRWARFLREYPELASMASKDKPLVKCIWSNLMLGWLASQFDCRIVLIVRHPGAVIESELRNNWNSQFAVERFRADATLHEMTGNRYRALLDRELSAVERLAIRWLVENQWNIARAGQVPVTVVHYEQLVADEESCWQGVCRALELARVPDGELIRKPSQQSAHGAILESRKPGHEPRWQASLTPAQKSRIQAILDECEFSMYTMDAAQPHGIQSAASTNLKRDASL